MCSSWCFMLNIAMENVMRFKCTNLSALVSWSVTFVYFIPPAQITPMHKMKAPKVWKEMKMFVKNVFDEDMVDIGQKNQPVMQFTSQSASLQDATPLNLGQFGTVPYQPIPHDHSQIDGLYQALSQYMLGQTLHHLYSTSCWHLLYMEQSFRQLLEMFSPVQRIRYCHIQIPGLTYRR